MVLSISSRVFREWHPLVGLTLVFILWKSILLLIALTSPGTGYDTSTTLLDFSGGEAHQPGASHLQHAVSKFVRWDAIYFTQMAQRGHVFEQEWAFGRGISGDLSWTAQNLFRTDKPTLWHITIGGLALSHLAHFGSMVLIWLLTWNLAGPMPTKNSPIASVAALLYIFSPAGIFLSAPYTESVFALLSFLGLSLYVSGTVLSSKHGALMESVQTILSGAVFGWATVRRSNGILAGIFFAIDAVESAAQILRGGLTMRPVVKLGSTVTAGLLAGWGMVWPQLGPYTEYCVEARIGQRRPWCDRLVPSIFTFVQAHYWNVGPFRYWTVSNLPLFLLAAPTLCLLIYSAAQCIPLLHQNVLRQSQVTVLTSLDRSLLWRLAIPQLALALLALTSYHVQIITRISSGYPLWYIWLAALICKTQQVGITKGIFRWMIVYAIIQAGLYASFLPPA